MKSSVSDADIGQKAFRKKMRFNMTVSEILEQQGMNRKELAEKFGIPYTTVQKWCFQEDNQNYRKCPEYVVRMMAYIFELEKLK